MPGEPPQPIIMQGPPQEPMMAGEPTQEKSVGREVPHNCLARGPYGGQYKCCVIIDYYSERFECYSLNVPYNFFERIGNGDFFRDPMPGQPSHPIILQSQQQMMDSESASSRLLFWNPDSLIFDLFNIICKIFVEFVMKLQ
ncbi:hypothetical protein QR680_006247 [Steinernema hermaphroditum]|uniref:Uncharacterized protein n=1 Tax=Steinernema hermaphroditum TaxID=289476 RepID=A0AA39HX07_9BILA|nr:hypothetical protein QR680_006247 [Steinernema hermaphroditum]